MLEGLAYSHGAFSSFEQEPFPGFIYLMKQPKIVLLILVSGKIVLTGAKVVNDELVQLMGGEVSDLVFAKSGLTVILLAGLQGVGKTTMYSLCKACLISKKRWCFPQACTLSLPYRLLVLIDQTQVTGEELYADCCRCLQACCH